MKIKQIIVIFILLLTANLALSQAEDKPESSTTAQPTDETKKEDIKYFTYFYDNFLFVYKEDKFEDTKNEKAEDPINDSKIGSFFEVRFKDGKPARLGFYEKDKDGKGVISVSQYVNFEGLPYYYITYSYNKGKLSRKEFRDKDGKVLAYYWYFWTKDVLDKVERREKPPIFKSTGNEERDLQSYKIVNYNEFKWEGNKLKMFTYYGNDSFPIERYTFKTEGSDVTDPAKKEKDARFRVGNNELSIFVLNKYERFKIGTSDQKIFYLEFQAGKEKNVVLQKRFTHDGNLVEIRPIEIPAEAEVKPAETTEKPAQP